jgi:helicase
MNITGFLKEKGIPELFPPQRSALGTKFLEKRKNLVMATPTASGKTLIAEFAALKTTEKGKKVVYTCPLRALASEQCDTFRKNKGIKVALSVGDYDSRGISLKRADWIVTTYEKLDSLMRHRAPWIPDVGLLIVDEIHEIGSSRGPTVEILITRFRELFPKTQVLALSATVPNAKEMGEWLDASVVESDWRPVKLSEGIYLDGTIRSTDGEKKVKELKTPTLSLVKDTLDNGGCALVFVNTRKSAEATAVRLKQLMKKNKQKLSEGVLNALESPTKQCRCLADCVSYGVAFHHAGLVHKQRRLVEDAFRQQEIRAVVATPTLAAGINLPAERVIMRGMTRYSGAGGVVHIPVSEYKQRAGRAGRPQYGKPGESVIICNSDEEAENYWESYVMGSPEPAESHVGIEPVLRMHALANIAMRFTPTMESLNKFFSKTFYAHQYKDTTEIEEKLEHVVAEFEVMGFVERVKDKLIATVLGARVSELYVDPLSAYNMILALKNRKMQYLGYLYMICDTDEMRPYLNVKRSEESALWTLAYTKEKELGIDAVRIGYEDFLFMEKFKTGLLLNEWISERSDDDILEDYGIAPGILRGRLRNAEWLCYAAMELTKILKLNEHIPALLKLQTRIKYGVQGNLLPLVELKGVGRVRARRLFNAKYRSVRDLENASLGDLVRILGPGIAASVKKQLGQEVDKQELKKARLKESPRGQTTLGEYSE